MLCEVQKQPAPPSASPCVSCAPTAGVVDALASSKSCPPAAGSFATFLRPLEDGLVASLELLRRFSGTHAFEGTGQSTASVGSGAGDAPPGSPAGSPPGSPLLGIWGRAGWLVLLEGQAIICFCERCGARQRETPCLPTPCGFLSPAQQACAPGGRAGRSFAPQRRHLK
jgi:hypothetical protein